MNMFSKWIVPAVVVLIFAGYLGSKTRTPEGEFGDFKLYEFGKLPVLYQGRVKPIDTLARNSLTIVSDSQEWYDTAFAYVSDLREEGDTTTRFTDLEGTVAELLVRPGDEVKEGAPILKVTVTDGEGDAATTRTVEVKSVASGTVEAVDAMPGDRVNAGDVALTFEGEVKPAIEWLLEVQTLSSKGYQARVFRIQNLQLLDLLGLEPRKAPSKHRFRYSFMEFSSKLALLDEHERQARMHEAGQRDALDTQVMTLASRIREFIQLQESSRLTLVRAGEEAQMIARRYPQVALLDTQQRQMSFIRQYQSMSQFPQPHLVPPGKEDGDWKPFTQVSLEATVGQANASAQAAFNPLMTMFLAYADGDAETFNTQLGEYQGLVKERMAYLDTSASKLSFEAFFYNFSPFLQCTVIYLFAFILACIGLLVWPVTLNRTVYGLLMLAAVVHTFAIIARIYISGYPPITNLYGTAIFIGWGAIVLCLIMEPIYKLGVGNLVAGVAGVATLLIAHNLAGDGDTLEMMQAVLDTKFWLATHVIIINLGYMAMIVAGLMAVFYILQLNQWGMVALGAFCIAFAGYTLQMYLQGAPDALTLTIGGLVLGVGLLAVGVLIMRGVLGQNFSDDDGKKLSRMIYGVVCFGLLMSFVGTVLGGLWADDSWGRFWGWDPKENGALMIVLWAAMILHARWGGMIKQRGIAVLAVGGNIVTAWSWFGVNQLGVGLHSYGFMDSAVFWLFVFVISQLVVMGVGSMPLSMWKAPTPARKTSDDDVTVPGGGAPAGA